MSERVDVRKNLRIALQHVLICGPDAFVQAAIEQADDAVARLVEAATRANSHHTAPHDCYATGPLTGNPVRDLVECPGCVLAQVLARFGSES